MPNRFDDKGIVVQGVNDFRRDLVDAAKVAFADKLEGRELRADDSSVLGRIFAVVAKSLTENAEILPLILQSLDLNSATGQQLDNLLWNIHRIKRKPEAQSTGLVILHGDIGTYVSDGSSVSNSTTGDIYKTDSAITFSSVGANGIDIEVLDVGKRYELNYNIEGYLSQSPKIIVEAGTRDISIRNVADRLVDAVNNQSSYLSAIRNNDNTVKVYIKNEDNIGTFVVNDYLSIPRSYMPVYVTSTTYDSRESSRGQVSTIGTAKLGWRGVTNPFYIFPSKPIETDEEYRYRGKLLQQNNSGKYSSILSALKSVSGVVYENVQQNTSANATNSGITNNGVAVTVMGGNEDEIALAIFKSVSEGIATSGSIIKMVKDINGFEHEIRFSRPKIVPLEISMSLITYPNFPINGNAKIRQAIIEWFNNLNVGEDIHYSRLYEPINSIQGFAVKNLKFGYKGGTLSLEDIIIRHDEIATLSAEDIIIGGSRGTKNVVDVRPTEPTEPTEPCMSSGIVDFLSRDGMPSSGTARYRLNNGDWKDFSGTSSGDGNLVVQLFNHINNNSQVNLFYTGMDSDGKKYAFYSPEGEFFIGCGELIKSDDNYYQASTDTPATNVIEFEVTSDGYGDLVQFLFGGNKKLMSCALSEWYGR